MTSKNDTVTVTIRKSHMIFGGGVVIGLGLGYLLGAVSTRPLSGIEAVAQEQTGATTDAAAQPPAIIDVSYEGRPYQGPADAPLTLVEFVDYQCPFCRRFFSETYPTLNRVYGDRIKYVVRNYPMRDLHSEAAKAAEAAECASDQDKFWEYRDVLFQRQAALDVPSLRQYADELGLDVNRFSTCLGSGEKAEVVLADLRDGSAYGVTGTPTFFINGRKLVGAQPFSVFQTLIEQVEESVRSNGG